MPVGSGERARTRRPALSGHCSVIRSASVASIAMAASGRSRRIAFSPCAARSPAPGLRSARRRRSRTGARGGGRRARRRGRRRDSRGPGARFRPARSGSRRHRPRGAGTARRSISPSRRIVAFGSNERSIAPIAIRWRSSGSRRSNSGTRRSASIVSRCSRPGDRLSTSPPWRGDPPASPRIHGSPSSRRRATTSSAVAWSRPGRCSTSCVSARPRWRSPIESSASIAWARVSASSDQRHRRMTPRADGAPSTDIASSARSWSRSMRRARTSARNEVASPFCVERRERRGPSRIACSASASDDRPGDLPLGPGEDRRLRPGTRGPPWPGARLPGRRSIPSRAGP